MEFDHAILQMGVETMCQKQEGQVSLFQLFSYLPLSKFVSRT